MEVEVGAHIDNIKLGLAPERREEDDTLTGRAHGRRELDNTQPGLCPPLTGGHGTWGGRVCMEGNHRRLRAGKIRGAPPPHPPPTPNRGEFLDKFGPYLPHTLLKRGVPLDFFCGPPSGR